jgi:hypothetical protein
MKLLMAALLRCYHTVFNCFLAAWLAIAASSDVAGEEQSRRTLTWSLRDEFQTGAARENPNSDRDGHPAWHFLRTTRSEGPIESRKWLRDGRYAPLTEKGDRVFGLPFDGWIFRLAPAESPVVSAALEDKAGGLAVLRGDIIVAPGPEHAMVVAWESPVSGTLDIQGNFEHAQASSGVAWYVERGPHPDAERGFEPVQLASSQLKFGTEKQRGDFAVCDQKVAAGEFVYFIVDAQADGTPSPHPGDGTRLDVTITVRDAVVAPPPSFEKVILPLLVAKCHDCHGADVQESQLDLRSLSEILRGGENGPALVRGDPHGSLLVDLVTTGQMPPGKDDKLSSAELALLRRWIAAGVPAEEKVVALPPRAQVTEADRAYWAFQPPRKTAEPDVKQTDRVRSPIDRFLLAKLEAKGLGFSPDADKTILIRRAYFDLIGLPPEPAAVDAFLKDERPNAYELLIDELLKSPHYGERWGRHWLDAAGYVDTHWDGDAATLHMHENLWKYRDYVIRAFNDNKPIDRFLTEQLAGDELVDWRSAATLTNEDCDLLAATGYLRAVEDHTNDPQYGIEKKYEVLFEAMEVFSSSTLGLTMECCRCHNHKYDPLPQRDYYRLMAYFESSLNVHDWKNRSARVLPDVSQAEKEAIDAHNAESDRQIAEIKKLAMGLRQRCREQVLAGRLASIPEPIRADVQQSLAAEPMKRSEVQKYLAEKFQTTLAIADTDIDNALTEAEKVEIAALAKRETEIAAGRKSYGHIQALWDMGTPPVSRVFRRGVVGNPGLLVQPGFPEILRSPSQPESTSPVPLGATSGRRLALASWVTSRDNPLTARVFVNRVWHHHFGRGIVVTLGNFGRSGAEPTHPELLDWLAVDFQTNGWNLKLLHKQIMTSTAYRQAHQAGKAEREAGLKVDPSNQLLWRSHLKRLDAEIVRDAILATSGQIDLTAGGPPVKFDTPTNGDSQTDSRRRSIYLLARRVYPLKFLELFDAPIIPVNCTQRTTSANVLQSLALLNSEFLLSQSEKLAGRISEMAGPEIEPRVKVGFQIVFARQPTESELAKSLAFLNEQEQGFVSNETPVEKARQMALANFCHMLLSSNEFLYVE